jgi:hypothetical protein
MERTSSASYTIWETGGPTEHLGGVPATERLLARCRIIGGQLVLDLGCGTGYTASPHCVTHICSGEVFRIGLR